jgi:hypothetical protein
VAARRKLAPPLHVVYALDPRSRRERRFERETLEGWEVNDILREETGTDYLKMKEYYPEANRGETMTIAPGSGPSTDVSTPVAQPPVPAPVSDRMS